MRPVQTFPIYTSNSRNIHEGAVHDTHIHALLRVSP